MSGTTVVLASRNAKKIAELARILASTGLPADVVGSEMFGDLPEIPETGATFAENSRIKAEAVARWTGEIAIADDSGLCVDALNGMPGVLSARWAGGHGDDEANLRLVMDQLRDVPQERRGASFRCSATAARVASDGALEILSAEGRVDGHLTRAARGSNGFGYDPIFQPVGFTVTTAEMSSDEKDRISHRGQALARLAALVADWIPGRAG